MQYRAGLAVKGYPRAVVAYEYSDVGDTVVLTALTVLVTTPTVNISKKAIKVSFMNCIAG